jgi:hypothetical protein
MQQQQQQQQQRQQRWRSQQQDKSMRCVKYSTQGSSHLAISSLQQQQQR